MNNKSNILENIKNLWKKVIYYYINELLSSTLIFNNSFNNSSIEGKLIVLNNYMTKNIMEHKDSKSKVTFIIISEKKSINNCWNNGFYGKGNLSRSEPIWSEKILKDLMKRNSGINNQNLKNLLDNSRLSGIENNDINNSYSFLNNLIKLKAMSSKILKLDNWNKELFMYILHFGFLLSLSFFKDLSLIAMNPYKFWRNIKDYYQQYILKDEKQKLKNSTKFINMEYLQLELEEAFFLKYALNCISIKYNQKVLNINDCWNLFRRNINDPSDPFILKYVAYHYYRSQGWIVKEGLKYGVDYVLYQKGPMFSHSEYAISVIPVINDKENLKYTIQTSHEVNCTNRKLVYCYIIVPKDVDLKTPECLKRYSVYEIRMKRWNPDKTRN
ncbi:hypothetical protein LY90DRAFT_291981 [Neocallimastix californiae]|uniref:tRNA-splicing endonuclease subunit Sen2 n=1 Tax=Neocallimastix californiae TaxID=1754190 RepID=A0A1Y2CW05_9FUNG|nr:hypothetical protein LY90DRAFT_291981 [Neocallimastix californiae]|eukprot:ORY51201.1 hypothetical protein LY90DRAFT_291981 [Neocallimastix californiae]